jgi:hypothetical protein
VVIFQRRNIIVAQGQLRPGVDLSRERLDLIRPFSYM